MAFAELEGFGEVRADVRTGILASAIVNAWGANTSPEDFVPIAQEHKEAPRPRRPEELLETFRGIVGMMESAHGNHR